MLNTEAESVDDIVAANRNEASNENWMFIPANMQRQYMKAPVRSVVSKRASVERMSPGVTMGLISDILVSIPPVNRIMLRAIIPMNCALCGELNWSPSPSDPKSIPTRRKSKRVGIPNLKPVLLTRMLTNTSTAPSNSMFSLVKIITLFVKLQNYKNNVAIFRNFV